MPPVTTNLPTCWTALHDAVDEDAARELTEALDRFAPAGGVLELACGPGVRTEQLLRTADRVTAVDSSPEMRARARARVGAEQVGFVHADLFAWRTNDKYDLVFFGFWLARPTRPVRALLGDGARPCETQRRVFFVDDNARTPEELIYGDDSSVIGRRLEDGTAHRAVKAAHQPADLQARLQALGWDIAVMAARGPFYWGAGTTNERRTAR